ncbi:hypothetical protein ACF065_21455 [Streptomyces sp. NPDC015232]|uniref:hypothetical protein n=1 Tax=unclassified Streptomyces TaxID=2593676 RepID=UPI0037016ED8
MVEDEGMDPLMRVLSDEDLPEAADRDPEIAAARADVAVLREQLALLGPLLAGDAPRGDAPAGSAPESVAPEPVTPQPVAARVRGRGRRVLAWTLAASVVLAVGGVGVAYRVAHSGDVDGVGGSAKLTPEAHVACATDIAEGTVARVEPLAEEGGLRVVLQVEHRYKPASGERRLVFRASDSPDSEAPAESYFRVGTRMLVVVSRFADEGPLTFREGAAPPGEIGDDVGEVRDELEYGRKWIEGAMPGASGLECPGRG